MLDDASPSEVTRLLIQWNEGDEQALAKLFPLVEGRLKEIARGRLSGERRSDSLNTLGLVGDLYLKLTGGGNLNVKNRLHFYRAAAVIMRHIIIDHARHFRAVKRGQSRQTPEPTGGLEQIVSGREGETELILALSQVIEKLEKIDQEAVRLVEMKFFLGLTNQDISELLGVSERTVRRNLKTAIAWLNRELTRT